MTENSLNKEELRVLVDSFFYKTKKNKATKKEFIELVDLFFHKTKKVEKNYYSLRNRIILLLQWIIKYNAKIFYLC